VHCPFCNHEDTKVTDSRLAGEGHQIRRRRECLSCGERFTTFETAELVLPQVVKNDNTRQPFDQVKLRAGIMKSLEKRPVSREAVEAAVERIEHRLRVLGEREVPSREIGEIVMEELRQLDEVAYVRYASVYHRFRDVDSFREQLDRLDESRRSDPAAGQMSLLPDKSRDAKGKR
jgi:transcriptional repressor NrdR